MEEEEKQKSKYEKESAKITKIREKLIKKFDEHEKKITPDAITKKLEEIHKWIASHSHNRIIIKNKIALFDGNSNSANLSRTAKKVVSKLKTTFFNAPLKAEIEK